MAWVERAFAGALWVGALAACTGHGPPLSDAPRSEGTFRVSGSEPAGARSEVGRGDGLASALQNKQSSSSADGAGPRFFVPSTEVFLEAPLPRGDASRYSAFSEKKRVVVGHGSLYDVRVFPGQEALLVTSGEERAVRTYAWPGARLLSRHVIEASPEFVATAAPWPIEPGSAADRQELFVTASPRGLSLISGRTGELMHSLAPEPADALLWSADGRLLLSWTSDTNTQTSVVRFYQVEQRSLELIGVYPTQERVDALALSRDNRLLALVHYPFDDVRVVDLKTGHDLWRVPAPKYSSAVTFSPDGRYLAVAGQGLLVVDLLNAGRRAFFGHIYNNLSDVEFSPSGDALAASAYDGKVRLFTLNESVQGGGEGLEPGCNGLSLELVRELAHSGTANVYDVEFLSDGTGLFSSSGDRTVRFFGGAAPRQPQSVQRDGAPVDVRFRNLDEWRAIELERAAQGHTPMQSDAPPLVMKDQSGSNGVGLDESVRPSRLRTGRYDCKISAEYRLRDCIIFRDEFGHTHLRFGPENLFALDGVVFDDGAATRFRGRLYEPSSVYDCKDCEKQPILGVLRGTAERLEGVFVFRNYYDPLVPPESPRLNVRVEDALDRFSVQLIYRGPLVDEP